MNKSQRSWRNLSPRVRIAIGVGAVVQLGLLGAAQVNIHRRSAEQLNGPRWLWIAVSFINFLGPIAYFLFGRRRRAIVPVPPLV
jgi:hypothetical protein